MLLAVVPVDLGKSALLLFICNVKMVVQETSKMSDTYFESKLWHLYPFSMPSVFTFQGSVTALADLVENDGRCEGPSKSLGRITEKSAFISL